jgi:hypothetical protein
MDAQPTTFTATVEAAPPRRVATGVSSVLAGLTSWRSEADAQHQRQLDEVDEEVGRLKTAIEDLQRQLTALADFRGNIVAQAQEIDVEHARRAHHGIFADFKGQTEALEARARAAVACEQGRRAAVGARLAASPLAATFEEYKQFKAGLGALQALPASYRDTLLAHHAQQEAALRSFVAENDPGPSPLQAPPLGIDIVFTVDTSEDQPELISVVLPVREAVYQQWEANPDDLQVQIAARVVEGMYRAAHDLGVTRAQAMSGDHRGMLAVELELGRDNASDSGERFAAAIMAALVGAPELQAAAITVQVHRVPTEYLLPPDEANDSGELEVNDGV